MPNSTTETLFQSYRISDNALASTFNLTCGRGGGAGINCVDVLFNNPQGGAGCNINMGSSVNSGWHHFYMSEYNSDTYLYVCNGAQHSSSYNLNHRFWVGEKHPAVLTASTWNGTKGGIVAFRANGTVTINNGAISTLGLGYRGGSAQGALWNTARAYSGESFDEPSTQCSGSTACSTAVSSTGGGGAGSIISSGGPGGSHGSLGTNGVASYSGYEPNKVSLVSCQAKHLLLNACLWSGGGGGAMAIAEVYGANQTR